MPAFADFVGKARQLAPRTAVVLGSGLAGAARAFAEHASVGFGDIPGLALPTVAGHGARLAVGLWGGTPALLFLGRLHFYEGHPREVVTGGVRVAADLGVTRVVLTNAAGGIRSDLHPGALMALTGHLKLLGPDAWRAVAAGGGVVRPYSARLLEIARASEAAAGRELPSGVYAALTGPSYETPAEIRALAACGADAVGMSTALESEEAARLGLEVAAVSCVTNKAAGLGGATLDHTEVLENAKLAVERMGALLGTLVAG